MTDTPACRQCGCNDVDLLGRFDSWGEPHLKLKCNHCRLTFSVRAPDAGEPEEIEPAYYVLVCRNCGGNMRVTSKRHVRLVKCSGCGRTEKVREVQVPI